MTCVRAEPAPASDRSPFMPEGAAGPGAAAATENAPLEYRGVVSTKSGKLYALYDPAKHQSVWVRLNEQGSDYVIRSADDTNDTITVNYQGRQMTLAMKQAKVETMAVSAPPVAPSTPNGIRPPPGMNPSSPANAAEEQRRLEAVAAEVRRRRMMRAQAAGQQPPMPPVQPGR
ncbi:MAG TPA: hypothetical protein VIM69_09805 [Opitutaceae bacterium]